MSAASGFTATTDPADLSEFHLRRGFPRRRFLGTTPGQREGSARVGQAKGQPC